MMTEILTIIITISTILHVGDKDKGVTMINFGGHAESEYFIGDVLPGGVDTQVTTDGQTGISARYMLEGTDKDGKKCHIFVENNKNPEDSLTTPKIVTDSPALKFLEEKKLAGKIDFADNQLVIRIYTKDE